MEDFYKLFNISYTSSLTEIMSAYQEKISKYNKLLYIDDLKSKEIKELKKGLYILTNSNLKKIYDEKLSLNDNSNDNSNNNSNDNNIKCANVSENEATLDELFSQNLLIKNNYDNNDTKHDTKIENNLLGDRVFSLSHMNKVNDLNSFSLELRKPLTGRTDKNNKMIV